MVKFVLAGVIIAILNTGLKENCTCLFIYAPALIRF
jgi:hypothetical protein